MSIKVFRIIGEGLSSQVMECTIDSKNYAMKVFKNTVSLEQRQLEIEILSSLDHDHILKYICQDPDEDDPQWFVTELLQDKDLFDYISINKKPFSIEVSHYIFKELLDAIEYLHSKNYSHRDIKLENILLTDDFELRLSDFGFAQHIETTGQKSLGTVGYMAPELYNYPDEIEGEDLFKTDIFSFGVSMFIVVFGYPPFESTNLLDNCSFWRVFQKDKVKYWQAIEKRLQNAISAELKHVFNGMLDPNPKTRYSMDQIRSNPWVSKTLEPEQRQQYFEELRMRKALFQ